MALRLLTFDTDYSLFLPNEHPPKINDPTSFGLWWHQLTVHSSLNLAMVIHLLWWLTLHGRQPGHSAC